MERIVRKVKKISPSYLKNLALWYLERFGGTRARVRTILLRRVQAAEQAYGPTPNAKAWVQETLDTLTAQGLINDAEFARTRVAKGLRLGKSRRLIAQDLAAAGVDAEDAEQAIREGFTSSEDPELEAAKRYAAKRGLGHHRPDPAAFKKKDMGAMARRGFSYNIARRALLNDKD